MRIEIPELAVVVLIGASGSGKSTFARSHFLPSEIVSSDACRAIVDDDEASMSATDDAFDLLHHTMRLRLKRGRLTVVDATNVQPGARKPLLAIAREFHAVPVAIVLKVPPKVCHERNQGRPNRDFGPHVTRNHWQELRRSLPSLRREGFRYVYELDEGEIAEAEVVRTPLWPNKKELTGPFDIVGDVHGCFDELLSLLDRLGYAVETPDDAQGTYQVVPPAGRRLIFVGDLVDRGPRSADCLRLVMDAVAAGAALAVPGNHDDKLLRKLQGRDVKLLHGLEQTWAELEAEGDAFKDRARQFLDGLVSHLVLDGGRLVVAHAGLPESMQGRASGAVRSFSLYGDVTGETDEYGLPVRHNWAAEYRGSARVVYGHTPVAEAEWLNRAVNIDTGCAFGGRLTALRYPELEFVSVAASKRYADPVRPLLADEGVHPSLQTIHDDVLDMGDLLGRRTVNTSRGAVMVREEQAIVALEVLSRFSADPRWLAYLPPTMSPCATSTEPGYLEFPSEAFAYYRENGVQHVVCQEKHMGSRAVVVVGRNESSVYARFGVEDGGLGIVTTRTGRPFFEDRSLEQGLLAQVSIAFEHVGLWDELETDWAILDAELMPWSAKALQLLQTQYAPVATSAVASYEALRARLGEASRHLDVSESLSWATTGLDCAQRYQAAYRSYCWDVLLLDDLRLAPFHLLATEGRTYFDQDHRWHLSTLARLVVPAFPCLQGTRNFEADLHEAASVEAATQWWLDLTASGGEGMVVKPLNFVAVGSRGLVQPAVKCRGREYLRIIYGPEYDREANLARLRERGLGRKQALARKEFILGLEALDRFVRREPLRQVHECVFAILAMESEPVDPRL